MTHLTDQFLKQMISNPHFIRNVSIFSQDSEDEDLIQALEAKASLLTNQHFAQAQSEVIAKIQTIKPVCSSLCFEYNLEGIGKKPFLINLIKEEFHRGSQHNSLTLKIEDSALVIVDAFDGVSVAHETFLQQSLAQKVKSVLMIDNLEMMVLRDNDRNGESIYKNFITIIEAFNVVLSNYEQPDLGDISVNPSKGTVAFGSSKGGWAFTLDRFTALYAKKFGIEEKTLKDKFWGDNYYDDETKKWTTKQTTEDGKLLKRGFVNFILDPIIKLIIAVNNSDKEQMSKMLEKIEITLSNEEKDLLPNQLLKTIMSKWLGGVDSLLEMMIVHLPSPVTAQKYRTALLYKGPEDDACAQAIRECNPNGPLMVYVSKMIPTSEKGRFLALGRIFSGTVSQSQKVRILGPDYKPGQKQDLFIKNIQKIVFLAGRKAEIISEAPCGNIVGIVGIDQYLVKSGTVTDNEETYGFRCLRYSSSPLIKIGIEPKNAQNLPKFLENLRYVGKSLIYESIKQEENGQYFIIGNDETSLETCLVSLESDFAYTGCEIQRSDPIVIHQETISGVSQLCLAKSGNKHNRLYCTAQPLSDGLCKAIEQDNLNVKSDFKQISRMLSTEFEWDKEEAQRIWTFGPDQSGPNILVNLVNGVEFINEVRDSCDMAFQWATKEGGLCEEKMRGVRMNLVNTTLHVDAIHRGGGQIIPAARRVYYACQLTAQPRLVEPVYMVEMTAPPTAIDATYVSANRRRGVVVEEKSLGESGFVVFSAHLPVSESFGFQQELRSTTGGQTFAHFAFSYWKELNEDPFDMNSKAFKIVNAIRKSKGLPEELPRAENYMDNF